MPTSSPTASSPLTGSAPRYLIVTQHFPSPESWRGSFVFDFACALLRTGRYRVSVFVPGPGVDYTLPLPAPLQGELTVHRFPRRALRGFILPFRFARCNRAAFLQRLSDLAIAPEEVAICHAHGAPMAEYPLALKALNPRIRTLLHHHSLDDSGLAQGLLRHVAPHQRLLYRAFAPLHAQIDEHVFISRAAERAFRAIPDGQWSAWADYRRSMRCLSGLKPLTLRAASLLPNGVDPTRFHPAPAAPHPFTLGCVANFVPLKGHLTLLRALALAAADLPADWRLRCIGTGPTRRTCERFIRRTPALRGHVTFEPERDHSALPDFFRALDLFVLPSIFEGFGCVYAEAAACGIPFIAYAGQGTDDWVPSGHPALVPPRDPAALAERIRQFLRAPWSPPAPPTLDAALAAWLPHLDPPPPAPDPCDLILPAYRAARWLPDLLASLRAQTFTAWTCLAVDDGSPDESGRLLDEAVRADARFRILHTRNGGVSRARNRALDRATAPWIGFLDADDSLRPGWLAAFADLRTRFPQADLLRLRMTSLRHENYPPEFPASGCASGEALPATAWTLCAQSGWVFLYQVRRATLGSLRFAPGYAYKEDALFYSALIPRLRALAWDNFAGYDYRLTPGSALRRPRRTAELCRAFREATALWERTGRTDLGARAMTDFCWGSLTEYLRAAAPEPPDRVAELWRAFAELTRAGLWREEALERKFLPFLHHLLRTGNPLPLRAFNYALERWRWLRHALRCARRTWYAPPFPLAHFPARATDPLCLLINLDRAPDRLAAMRAQLRGLPWERLRAVDGLPPGARVARFRFWLANARRIIPAEVGCALSHQRAYARFLGSSATCALILEDDVRLDCPRLEAALAYARAHLPIDRPTLWLLHGCSLTEGTPEPAALTLCPAAPHAWSTAAYLLNRPAARLLQRANTPVRVLADDWDSFRAQGLDVRWLRPFPFSHRPIPTSILPASRPRRADWAWYRALWRLRHALGSRLARALSPNFSHR